MAQPDDVTSITSSPHHGESSDQSAVESLIQRHNICIHGEGSEYVIFGHGFGMNQAIWDYILPYIDTSKFAVVLFDLVGAYGSPVEGFDFSRHSTLHGFADDLLEMIHELDIESCIFVGHCMTGMIGLLASIEAPRIFRKLILINPCPRFLADDDFEGFTLDELDQAFSVLRSNFLSWSVGEECKYGWKDLDNLNLLDLLKSLFLTRPDIALSLGKTLFQADMRDLLPRVSSPVHLFYTEGNGPVPQSSVEYIWKNIKQSCFVILPPLGHMPHLTDPDVLGPLLKAHLEDDGSLFKDLESKGDEAS